eukprot:Hpha_TRINITY_DN16769_c3_g2::TRINITY_DN16769_c3_g2_i1::g.76963::m.76963/K04710/CERS; ceramide synthetase
MDGVSKLQKARPQEGGEEDSQPRSVVQLSVAFLLLALALPKVQRWKWSDVPRSAPTSEWLYLSVCVFAFYTAARAVLFPLVLRPGARLLGAPDSTKSMKVAQQSLNLFHHTACTVMAIKLLSDEDMFYWNNPLGMWKGWAEGTHMHTAEVHALYMVQLGYHSYCLAFHFTDPKRDDFMQMLVHHAVTAYLIYQSYASNFVHVGLLVLFAHDSSDVVGCSIKITNYLNWKYVTVAIFPVLLFMWAYTRLYLFPTNCIVASWKYTEGFQRSSGYCACFLLMFVILGLNAYWYFLFLRILVNLMRSSVKNPCTTDLSEEKSPI